MQQRQWYTSTNIRKLKQCTAVMVQSLVWLSLWLNPITLKNQMARAAGENMTPCQAKNGDSCNYPKRNTVNLWKLTVREMKSRQQSGQKQTFEHKWTKHS